MFQIFIKFGMNGSNTITLGGNPNEKLSANTKVREIFKMVEDREGLGSESIRLIYGGKELSMSKPDAILSDYGIHNESTLHGVMRLLGGSQPKPIEPASRDDVKYDENKLNKEDIKTEKDKECDICGDNKNLVIIHTTGNTKHKACSQCIYGQCRAKVWNGDTSIKCPISCDYVIPYKKAFTMAGFNNNEWKQYELRLNMNAIPFKACPNQNCGIFIMKDRKGFRVRCPKCKLYDFCWSCLKKWKGNDDRDCGNNDCSILASMIKQINDSWEEREHNHLGSGIPKIRICPNPQCQLVNEWVKACRHITCGKGTKIGCTHNYCQKCLRPWQGCKCAYCAIYKQKCCPGLGSDCELHDVQTIW